MTQVWWKDTPDETLRETSWERQMNIGGMEHFELMNLDKNGKARDAADTGAGQKVVREMIKKTSLAIEEMQKEVIDLHRVDRSLKATVLMVPAEACALITLRTLLSATYGATNALEGVSYQVLCKDIYKSIELELNYRN